MNVKRRVAVWRSEGIVSEDVAARIVAYEESRGGSHWVGYGIAGIGVTAIATGIVSLVAANWDSLSDAFKLAMYFLAQIALGAIYARFERREGLWREIALTLFALLFWGGIGLVGQIFNLSGTWWNAIALWCVLTLPAALSVHSRLLPFVWAGSAVVAPLMWSYESNTLFNWLQGGTEFVLLSTTMALATAYFLGKRCGKLREEFTSALLVCSVGVLLVVATPWANLLWSEERPRFSYLGLERSTPWVLMMISWGATVIAVGASVMRAEESRERRVVSALLLLSAAAYLSIPYLFDLSRALPGALNDIGGAVGFLVVWSLAAAAAALASRPRLFDMATVVLALRFIIIYFEVFGSLTTTGLGLIVSGAVIVGIGVLWNKGRKAVKELAKERA